MHQGKIVGFVAAAVLIPMGTVRAADEEGKFGFHGYFRTTFGASNGGENMVSFQAPGARAKYRLGNEADNYMELIFDYTLTQAAGRSIQTVFNLAGYGPVGAMRDISPATVAESYIKFNKYLGDADVWAGRRFYQRHDIHMIDYFWLNAGQDAAVGAGVENINAGFGKFHVAGFNFEQQDVAVPGSTPASTTTVVSRELDLRLTDIKLGSDHTLNAWVGYFARPKSQSEAVGKESRDGTGISLWLDSKIGPGNNTFAIVSSRGLANANGGKPHFEDDGFDLKKNSTLDINDNYVMDADSYSLQAVALMRTDDNGTKNAAGKENKVTWTSVGVRPIFHLNETNGVALELGMDQIKDDGADVKGSLNKITAAYQISRGKGYYVRPTIRAFVTNASWSSEFKGAGSLGQGVYADKTSGWSTGVSTEVWW